MPIPPLIIAKIVQLVVKLAPRGVRGVTTTEKVIRRKIGQYAVLITRRSSPGHDGGISHIVKIFRNGKTDKIIGRTRHFTQSRMKSLAARHATA